MLQQPSTDSHHRITGRTSTHHAHSEREPEIMIMAVKFSFGVINARRVRWTSHLDECRKQLELILNRVDWRSEVGWVPKECIVQLLLRWLPRQAFHRRYSSLGSSCALFGVHRAQGGGSHGSPARLSGRAARLSHGRCVKVLRCGDNLLVTDCARLHEVMYLYIRGMKGGGGGGGL